MNDRNSLVEKILADANAEALKIVATAEAEADELFASAKKHADGIKKAGHKRAKELETEILKSRKTVSFLDGKKIVLSAKKELLDSVYTEAVKAIKADKKAYQKLLESMLATAEDGDVVLSSLVDEKIVTTDFVKSVADKKKLKLALSPRRGDFFGGIILEGKNADKNLTLEFIADSVRVETEAQTAADIFRL